jgi:broad specificity phosphatase PhoE
VTITLLRHGHAGYEAVEHFVGHGRDLAPLSAQGIAAVERAVARLASHPPDVVLSSPMTRALQTAAIVGRCLDREVVVEVDLHEWMPDADQRWRSWDEVAAAVRDFRAFGGEWPDGEPRSWEPMSAVRRRVGAVLGRHDDGRDLLVVTHSMVIEAVTGVVGCAFGEGVDLPG